MFGDEVYQRSVREAEIGKSKMESGVRLVDPN